MFNTVIETLIEKKRYILIGVAVIVTLLVIISFVLPNNDNKKKPTTTTTTTTTLPEKNAQACEFLTLEALAAGGIVPDVEPKTTDNKKRCTFEDIGGQVNYITLYVDVINQCTVLRDGFKEAKAADEISPGAVFSDETDPTVVVPLGTRCFFVQGSKTILDRESLTQIAKAVTALFVAVDATTTTTTSAPVILPETSVQAPGVNTAPNTTTTTTAKKVGP